VHSIKQFAAQISTPKSYCGGAGAETDKNYDFRRVFF
jgi:hypothetical protein